MADYLLRLTEVNMEATRDAINVFDLYDLEVDTSYPFLDQRNWKVTGSREIYDITYEDRGKRVDDVSMEALNSFNFTHDWGYMRATKAGHQVSVALRSAWLCLSANKAFVVGKMGLGPINMGCRDQPAAEGMVSLDFMVQTVTFVIQERTGEILEALERGDLVYLLPPGYEFKEYEPPRRYAHLFSDR